MYRLFLALRYLRSRFVNLLSIGGVMMGVAVLIVVTSVFDGFQEQVREMTRGSLSHLVLTPKHDLHAEKATLPSFDLVEQRLLEHDKRIAAVSPQLSLPIVFAYQSRELSWAKIGKNALLQMEAVGIRWDKEQHVSTIRDRLLFGDLDDPFHDAFAAGREKGTVVVGRAFAEN